MILPKNQFGILYVDDEVSSLKYFKEAFGDIAPIYTAESPELGLDIFKSNPGKIGVVLSDKRMPKMSGIDFLKEIKKIDDNPLRILVTAFADLALAVESLNDGLLYSYLTKPWDPRELKSRLGRALDRFWITNERNKLLKERNAVYQKMIMAEKASSIQTVSGGLNHHLLNSLNVIQAYFDMIPLQLQEENIHAPKDSFFWGEYYHNVEEQITRALSIISSFGEGSEFWNANLELQPDIDLVAVFENAVSHIQATDPPFQFKITKMDEIGPITGDLKKISTMAGYLIEEAQKNIKSEDGAIEIQFFTTRLDAADGVRIRCIDNGPPVPEEERAHLFDPLHIRSDRPSEVGANLLYCYLTVFHHGGKIESTKLKDGRNVIELSLQVEPTLQSGDVFPSN